jgi:hypothetical protein
MLHAYFYTICLVFCYTSWHFYTFSRTNLLTSRHSASSLFSAVFVFQKSYIGNILGIGRNQSHSPRISPKLLENQRGDRVGPQGPHTIGRCGLGPGHAPYVWGLLGQLLTMPFAYKDPPTGKPKNPITFPEHIVICRRCRPKDWEGLEALPGTLSERGIATGGLLHRHACLQSDEWVVYFGLWVHSSS